MKTKMKGGKALIKRRRPLARPIHNPAHSTRKKMLNPK